MNKGDFISEIEEEPKDVFVVVHLYQKYVDECMKLNRIFSQLSKKYSTTKFFKIISTEAISRYDDIALPTVLIYKGGEQFATLVRFTDNFGKNFNESSVAYFLAKSGFIDIDKNEMEELKKEAI